MIDEDRKNGSPNEALELLDRKLMVCPTVPSYITFFGDVSVCAHARLVAKERQIFQSMYTDCLGETEIGVLCLYG